MAPSTFAGRLFCIFYALFGIPLCMLALKSIGERINELLETGFIIMRYKRQLRADRLSGEVCCKLQGRSFRVTEVLSYGNSLAKIVTVRKRRSIVEGRIVFIHCICFLSEHGHE